MRRYDITLQHREVMRARHIHAQSRAITPLDVGERLQSVGERNLALRQSFYAFWRSVEPLSDGNLVTVELGSSRIAQNSEYYLTVTKDSDVEACVREDGVSTRLLQDAIVVGGYRPAEGRNVGIEITESGARFTRTYGRAHSHITNLAEIGLARQHLVLLGAEAQLRGSEDTMSTLWDNAGNPELNHDLAVAIASAHTIAAR